MPERGVLTVSTRNLEDGWIGVQVEDTGCGMDPETLQRAMDPFFTTKPQGQGTGLGLALVYSTVKAHQGLLTMESEPGRGTRVKIRLPAAGMVGALQPTEAVASTEPSPRGLSVLLVDDDELIISSMQAVLEALGHATIEASTGEEAIRLLERGLQADLVIMDMNMPGLGGMGTLPLLQARWPGLPVLLATGRADQEVLDLVAAHPQVALLAKPFSMSELEKALKANFHI
jgi:CheY-like chemotaxis protein